MSVNTHVHLVIWRIHILSIAGIQSGRLLQTAVFWCHEPVHMVRQSKCVHIPPQLSSQWMPTYQLQKLFDAGCGWATCWGIVQLLQRGIQLLARHDPWTVQHVDVLYTQIYTPVYKCTKKRLCARFETCLWARFLICQRSAVFVHEMYGNCT